MPEDPNHIPKLSRIHLQLGQYPVLGDAMRERMREELFRRGVITRERFETEVREKAVQSQLREGIVNPYREESAGAWERRLAIIRDQLTEFYFAYNLSPQLFEEIAPRGPPAPPDRRAGAEPEPGDGVTGNPLQAA